MSNERKISIPDAAKSERKTAELVARMHKRHASKSTVRPLTDPYPPIEKMTPNELEFAFGCGGDHKFAIELAGRFLRARAKLSECDITSDDAKSDMDLAWRYRDIIDMALRIMDGESL